MIQFSPNGRYVAGLQFCVTGFNIVLWDLENQTNEGQLVASPKAPNTTIAFSPDDRYLALALRDGRVQLWDVEAKQHLFDWQAWPHDAGSGAATGRSRYLSFTPDGSAVAILDAENNRLQLLDLRRLNKQLAAFGLDWTNETNR